MSPIDRQNIIMQWIKMRQNINMINADNNTDYQNFDKRKGIAL